MEQEEILPRSSKSLHLYGAIPPGRSAMFMLFLDCKGLWETASPKYVIWTWDSGLRNRAKNSDA